MLNINISLFFVLYLSMFLYCTYVRKINNVDFLLNSLSNKLGQSEVLREWNQKHASIHEEGSVLGISGSKVTAAPINCLLVEISDLT